MLVPVQLVRARRLVRRWHERRWPLLLRHGLHRRGHGLWHVHPRPLRHRLRPLRLPCQHGVLRGHPRHGRVPLRRGLVRDGLDGRLPRHRRHRVLLQPPVRPLSPHIRADVTELRCEPGGLPADQRAGGRRDADAGCLRALAVGGARASHLGLWRRHQRAVQRLRRRRCAWRGARRAAQRDGGDGRAKWPARLSFHPRRRAGSVVERAAAAALEPPPPAAQLPLHPPHRPDRGRRRDHLARRLLPPKLHHPALARPLDRVPPRQPLPLRTGRAAAGLVAGLARHGRLPARLFAVRAQVQCRHRQHLRWLRPERDDAAHHPLRGPLRRPALHAAGDDPHRRARRGRPVGGAE